MDGSADRRLTAHHGGAAPVDGPVRATADKTKGAQLHGRAPLVVHTERSSLLRREAFPLHLEHPRPASQVNVVHSGEPAVEGPRVGTVGDPLEKGPGPVAAMAGLARRPVGDDRRGLVTEDMRADGAVVPGATAAAGAPVLRRRPVEPVEAARRAPDLGAGVIGEANDLGRLRVALLALHAVSPAHH